jgi:ubiquinol-cytochrome c reductase cytochrome b subunit
MIKALLNWADDRTGYRTSLNEALYERIPGGARWRYVFGSMLVFAFVTQMITGMILWMCYSPGSQNAYESVYWIQNELTLGWLLRGIHHFMAQAMVVLLPLHLIQVVIDKAYRAPREFNFWIGLILMLIVLALSLTGYLLPWDQKGFWATKVATNLMALAPGGEQLQKLVVGGEAYGHYTLTRFFALHAGVLPWLLVGFLVLHIAFFRKHGITAIGADRRAAEMFWPKQVFKDGIACLVLITVVLLLTIRFDVVGLFTGTLEKEHLGAHLAPPADATQEYNAARPEWYFLFLFQLLKKFESEFFGAIVLTALVMVYLFLMPIIGRVKIGHYLNVAVIMFLVAGAGYLTVDALKEDYYSTSHEPNPEGLKGDALAKHEDMFAASESYLSALDDGAREYHRVRELVEFHGIPRDGVNSLMRDDSEIMGPRLFRQHCASCHSYQGDGGASIVGPRPTEDGRPNGAPNLYKVGSREWLTKFLTPGDKGILSDDMFGRTEHASRDEDGDLDEYRMVGWVHANLSDLDKDGKKQVTDLIAALSAEAQLSYQSKLDTKSAKNGQFTRGATAITHVLGCMDCHKFGDTGGLGTAPDLTGYMSSEWLRLMIAAPEHERMYEATNDRMPAFAGNPDKPETNLLSDHDVDMLVRWLRQDDRKLKK